MFRKIAEVSEGINSVALVGSVRSSANSPRDLIDGVETKLSSSLEIVWLEVFVKVLLRAGLAGLHGEDILVDRRDRALDEERVVARGARCNQLAV